MSAEPDLELDPMDQRILGALLEKQVTVPASYPMTLNALRSACNQQSSRDPVTDYAERDLEERLRDLKRRGLVRIVWAERSSRAPKYHQLLEEILSPDPAERALLTVLLLRGPQAPGELRTRTERLHAFADRQEVEQLLTRMASGSRPSVAELPRQAGQHDNRWIHLLGPVPQAREAIATAAAGVDREAVLAEGGGVRDQRVRAAYDAVAAAYADELIDELDHKPFDRWLLQRFAAQTGTGPVADVGCGPGQVTAFLAGQGAFATGFDLSTGMTDEARTRFPALTFEVADLMRMMRPPAASGWNGITAWYALCHLAGSELTTALAALTRVLAPGGVLAFALHVGEAIHHADELFGVPIDLDFVMHDRAAVLEAARAAGLVDVEWFLRSPIDGLEVATERLYVWGRTPG